MSSSLVEVYALLAAMSVSYTDRSGATATPHVFNLDTFPSNIQTAILPCRILFPIGWGGQGMTLGIGPGTEADSTYTITDFFLLESGARGEGLFVQAPVLMRYVKAYADAISLKWQYASLNSVSQPLTVSVNIVPAEYNIPQGSDNWYYGVKCDLTISELL
jgi:hypothetical protein